MRRLPRTNSSQTVVSTFVNNGLLYGALLGALIGVLIAGPHFADWSIVKIIAAVAVSSAAIGATGHLSVWIVYAAIATGTGTHDAIEERDDSVPDGVHAIDD